MRDGFARLRREQDRKPPLAVVVASVIAAIGIWVLIYFCSGRVIWLW